MSTSAATLAQLEKALREFSNEVADIEMCAPDIHYNVSQDRITVTIQALGNRTNTESCSLQSVIDTVARWADRYPHSPVSLRRGGNYIPPTIREVRDSGYRARGTFTPTRRLPLPAKLIPTIIGELRAFSNYHFPGTE